MLEKIIHKSIAAIVLRLTRLWENRVNRYARYVSRLIGENDTVLDVGVGSGQVAGRVGELADKVTIIGVDFNADACREFSKRYSSVVADVHSLPFKSGSFDVAYCFSLLEHLEDPQKAVGEICRVTRSRICVQIPNMGYFFELHTFFPFLWVFPSNVRERVMKDVVPGMRLNFDLSEEEVIDYFTSFGYEVEEKEYLYHHPLTKLLILPQGFLATFKKSEPESG